MLYTAEPVGREERFDIAVRQYSRQLFRRNNTHANWVMADLPDWNATSLNSIQRSLK